MPSIDVLIPTEVGDNPRQVETIVDEDLTAFDEWFQSIGNEPVVRSERAILKTYLYWKLKVKGERHGEATGG